MAKRASIRIMLDRPRTMVLDGLAILKLEEQQQEVNFLKAAYLTRNLEDLRYFFWACLYHEDRNLTPEFVGKHILAEQFHEALLIYHRLLMAWQTGETDSRYLAPYVPTPDDVVQAALKLSGLAEGETLLDLGAGDGRVMVSALHKKAALVIGYEMHNKRAKALRDNFTKLNVLRDEHKNPTGPCILRQQDIMEADPADLKAADVVFVYLLTPSNSLLAPLLHEHLRPGTRVVTHDFPFLAWNQAERTSLTLSDRPAPHNLFLYKIGEHKKHNPLATGEVTLTQTEEVTTSDNQNEHAEVPVDRA